MNTDIKLCETDCAKLVRDLSTGEINSEQLKSRSGCAVYRIFLPQGSVILKVWKRPGLRGIIRHLTGTSPAQKEIRAVRLLRKANVAAPRLLGFQRVADSNLPWTDAVFFEDMGNCVKAMVHVKSLLEKKNEDELSDYLDAIIEMTQGFIRGGIVDPDHSFNNIVATPDRKAVRLDFERAFRSYLPWFPARSYGHMLGFLVSSYVFAVQPDIERASDFAKKLVLRLRPPSRVLKVTQLYIDGTMALQKRRNNVDIRFTLPNFLG